MRKRSFAVFFTNYRDYCPILLWLLRAPHVLQHCRHHRRRVSRPRHGVDRRSKKSPNVREKFRTRRASCHFSPPVPPSTAPSLPSSAYLRRIIRRAALREAPCVSSRLYATASRPSRVIILEFRRVLEGTGAPRRPSTVHHLFVAVRESSVIGAFAGRRRRSVGVGSTPAEGSRGRPTAARTTGDGGSQQDVSVCQP